MKCKIRKHMTINQHRGEKTIIFNYWCITHMKRGSYLDSDNRQNGIKAHKKEMKK